MSTASLREICDRLGLGPAEVYWLMTTSGLPGVLVDGTWCFDASRVDAWVQSSGGLDAVRANVRSQMEKHHKSDGTT